MLVIIHLWVIIFRVGAVCPIAIIISLLNRKGRGWKVTREISKMRFLGLRQE
jgi:hypothetical protein